MPNPPVESHPLDEAIAALEHLRGRLPAHAVDAAIASLRAQDGAIAQGQDALAVGAGGVGIGRDINGDLNTGSQLTAAEGAQIIYAEQGATIVIGDAPVTMTAVDRQSALGRYLQHLISQNRYLQLQGIRSGGKLVNIELDRIYVTLRATRLREQRAELGWLSQEMALAPGERHRGIDQAPSGDTTHVTVNEALADHRRLVVLGDPGCGKTTLLRYLTLLYARDLAEETRLVPSKLGIAETGWLPIFLPLRQIGRYLQQHYPNDDGTEGHAILLRFLAQMLENERIAIPADFFDRWLHDGQAAVLLDGLDEVADPKLRRRVSRLVDAFTRAYPRCRTVVTSRIVGYTDASQLTEGYVTTTVRDFTLEDIGVFLSQWHRLVAIGQMGPGVTAEAHAAEQTRQLLDAIEQKDRVRELAINPLMLTVIALVHRDRVKLPDRRADLYQEAVDVLLGKWDEAKGTTEPLILHDRPFDINDRKLVLQQVALTMHEHAIKEIDAEPLREILVQQLGDAVFDPREVDAAVERFLNVIQERTGLLIARAEGTYAFSHLTFQEYLAALAVAGRDDYVEYTLKRTAEEWWREVILLEAGYLSTQSKDKTTRLIKAIADNKTEPEPYHNLVLAAECVRDAGANRIVGNVETELRNRLQRELEPPIVKGPFAKLQILMKRGISPEAAVKQRIAAAEALGKIGGSQFWTMPHGEPDWVNIPAGEFTMGEGNEAHRVYLPDYCIARIPITNAQYELFVLATGHEPPDHWNGKRVPRGKEIHPVVCVSWHDALEYCQWLTERLRKSPPAPKNGRHSGMDRRNPDCMDASKPLHPWSLGSGDPCRNDEEYFDSTKSPPAPLLRRAEATEWCVTLPSEAEWEKAARGADRPLAYPWGDWLDAKRCNTHGCGFGGTTPVGIFPNGASPCGCLDMAGNVWEWTRSRYGEYPYPQQGHDHQQREDLSAEGGRRVLRGGAFGGYPGRVRCADRNPGDPDLRYDHHGFRVVVSPFL
ncbi:MAG: SUMF1/EgtB/PvdO family nonheme iron enzyme [Candidatus Methylumidiphilus sp.]